MVLLAETRGKNCVVWHRSAWWLMQETLTRLHFDLSKCHSAMTPKEKMAAKKAR
jgi:hypothetical protein